SALASTSSATGGAMETTPLCDHDWKPLESHPVAPASLAVPSRPTPCTVTAAAAVKAVRTVCWATVAVTVPGDRAGQVTVPAVEVQAPPFPAPCQVPAMSTGGRRLTTLPHLSASVTAPAVTVGAALPQTGGPGREGALLPPPQPSARAR